MTSAKHFCFKHSSGEDICLYTLKNRSGTTVTITNYGATITSFVVKQKNGAMNDIVLGFDDIRQYMSSPYTDQYPYFGAAIGRYGNRIKDARFVVDGKEYRLAKNNGSNNLHGGVNGFDKKVWKEGKYDTEKNFLVLKHHSPDGEEGFPGNLDVEIHYQLTDENELKFDFKATTDQPTPVNFTHHSYFNLDNGEGDIRSHMLKIYSSFYLQQDEGLAVTGALITVEGTHLDFREFRRIDQKWVKDGIDQSFVVEHAKDQLTLMAESYSDKSGIKLQVYSTDPIVHLYTGQGIPSLKGKQGKFYGSYSGFCLETQKHPNAINIPHFPNTILRPLEVYNQKNVYRVIVF